jgi:hypothetical protein
MLYSACTPCFSFSSRCHCKYSRYDSNATGCVPAEDSRFRAVLCIHPSMSSNDGAAAKDGPVGGVPPMTSKDPYSQDLEDPRGANLTQDGKNAKQRSEQLERPARICGCLCDVNCNCRCTCDCRAHCLCKSPCDGQCGSRVSQNLVVSIDGTSNQFGLYVSSSQQLGLQVDLSSLKLEHQRRGAPQSRPP